MAKKTRTPPAGRLALPIIAGVVLIAALIVLLRPKQAAAPTVDAGDDLTIPVSGITETASFYPITVDGVAMEVLAIRTADGEIRTAFNTCQSCYDSGNGYYTADGTELVCSNCGFRFTAEDVGVAGDGGCHPWPIPASDRTETADSIVISYQTLAAAKDTFANWK